MDELEKVRYEQASQDWRHRDQLTWQMPAILVVVGGLLVAEAFKLPDDAPSWVRNALLLFAFGLSTTLTLALSQNLILQGNDRKIIETIDPETKRFGFLKRGSFALLSLSIAVSIFLGWLCWSSIFGGLFA